MRRYRRLVYLPLLFVLLAFLPCCGGKNDPPAPPSPSPTPSAVVKTVPFTLPLTDTALHPILGSDSTNLTLSPLLWEGLFEMDDTFTPHRVLCDSYEVSPDALVWTFSLRTGITFSDGSPLTSAEVVRSIRLAMDSTRYSARLGAISSVTSEDEHTVTIVLKTPNGNLPALLDIPIVSGEGETPFGTGPYTIYDQAGALKLKARGNWWRKQPLPLSDIPLRMTYGADSLIHAFDTREISLVTTDLTAANALNWSTGYEALDCPTTIMLYVGFNTAKGAGADTAVRQAVSRSFDRATVASAFYAHHARQAVLPVSPVSPLYNAALAAEFDYSPQTAAEILDKAGYTLTDGVLRRGRTALSLTFLVNSENPFKVSVADYLAGELGRMGFEVDLQKLSWSGYEKALAAGRFDLYLGETMLTGDFDLTALFSKGGALNFGGYSSPSLPAVLKAFNAAVGDSRATAANDLYRLLLDDAPLAVLCFKNTSVLTQWGTVSGLSPTQQNAFYGLSDWQIGDGG